MRKLSLSMAIHAFILDLVYLWSRLLANPLTEKLAAHVGKQVEALEQIKAALEKAERQQVLAMARRDHADDMLDEQIRLAAKKSEAAFLSREAPAFRRLWSEAPSTINALPMEEQVRECLEVATKLDTCGEPSLAALAKPLRIGAETLQKAEAEWKASFQPVAVAAADRDYNKAQANILRDKVYGQLLAEFPGQRARVEKFFRDAKRRSASAETEEEVVEGSGPAET